MTQLSWNKCWNKCWFYKNAKQQTERDQIAIKAVRKYLEHFGEKIILEMMTQLTWNECWNKCWF